MTLEQHRRGVELAEALDVLANAYKDHQQTTKGHHDRHTEDICRKARYAAANERNALAAAENALAYTSRQRATAEAAP